MTLPAPGVAFVDADLAAAFMSTAQQIPPGTWTALAWRRVDTNPGGTRFAFDPAHPGRLTAPQSGFYRAAFGFMADDDGTDGVIGLAPGVNGVPVHGSHRRFPSMEQPVPATWLGLVKMTAGDRFETLMYQAFDGGAPWGITPGSVHLTIHYLGGEP